MKFENGMIVHCDTVEKALKLMKYLEANGYQWASGKKPTGYITWLGSDTCYRVCDEITYSTKDFYVIAGEEVVEFDDLDL